MINIEISPRTVTTVVALLLAINTAVFFCLSALWKNTDRGNLLVKAVIFLLFVSNLIGLIIVLK